jgi:hypothetical protein
MSDWVAKPVVVKILAAFVHSVCEYVTGISIHSALGLSQTSAMGAPWRLGPDPRSGGRARATSYRPPAPGEKGSVLALRARGGHHEADPAGTVLVIATPKPWPPRGFPVCASSRRAKP